MINDDVERKKKDIKMILMLVIGRRSGENKEDTHS